LGELAGQYSVSERQFNDQLSLLQKEDYLVEGFEQLELKLRLGQSVPSRYVVLTVDDGHESAMPAADLLGKYGCQASFFLTRDRSVSMPGYICEKDIRELRRRGFSVGTHGATHRKLTFLPTEHCMRELTESKRWLEDVIGEEVRYMAAPGGFIDARVRKLAYECGYVLLGTCAERMNSPDTMPLPTSVNRFTVRQHFSLQTFQRIVKGHPGFCLRRRVRAWGLAVPRWLLYRWDHH